MSLFTALQLSLIGRGLTLIRSHIANYLNPHRVTAAQLGIHTGTESLGAGITEVEIDLTAELLTATPSHAFVTMQCPAAGMLLYPVVVGMTSTTLTAAWQSATDSDEYELHWEVVE